MAGGPIRRMISSVAACRRSLPRSSNRFSNGSDRGAPLTSAASALARIFGSLAVRRSSHSRSEAELSEKPGAVAGRPCASELVDWASTGTCRIQNSARMNARRIVAARERLGLRELGEADNVASRLLHVELRASVERVVTRLDDGRTGERHLDSTEIIDGDEEHGRVADEFIRRIGPLRQHAGARLVHHFDVAALHAGKYQPAVVAGDRVLGDEPELLRPESKARLDLVDDEHWGQVPQAKRVSCR